MSRGRYTYGGCFGVWGEVSYFFCYFTIFISSVTLGDRDSLSWNGSRIVYRVVVPPDPTSVTGTILSSVVYARFVCYNTIVKLPR